MLMVKTWSKYTNELPNIVFNQMFTCFSCAGQNVASVMDTFRENCPLASMFMKTSSIHAMKFILVVNVLLSFLLSLSMSLIPFRTGFEYFFLHILQYQKQENLPVVKSWTFLNLKMFQ